VLSIVQSRLNPGEPFSAGKGGNPEVARRVQSGRVLDSEKK